LPFSRMKILLSLDMQEASHSTINRHESDCVRAQ
jgi:hypothetical protein